MDVTQDYASVLPNRDDIAFFSEHGWWISPVILSDHVLDAALEGVKRYRHGLVDRQIVDQATVFDTEVSQESVLLQNGYLSLQIREVARLVNSPAIAHSAALLTASEAIRLFHDRMIIKYPERREVSGILGWHTDRSYWRTCTSLNMITAWIPFHDTTTEMGTLRFVDRSHKWQGNDRMATAHEQDMTGLLERASKSGPVEEVPVVVKRGQVSFHHCFTIHGSGPNYSDDERIALAVHMQPSDNRYQKVFGDTGRPIGHLNDLLCGQTDAGEPDYTDPAIFPKLWPAAAGDEWYR